MENTHEPIPMRPLTMRGVFGITWTIMKRRLFGTTAFVFLLRMTTLAALAVLCAPAIAALLNGAGWYDGTVTVFILLDALLAIVIMLAAWLVLDPIINGTVYTEMSMRIYGQSSSLSRLFHRAKFGLKQFFPLNLCQSVANLIAGIAVYIISVILGTVTVLVGLTAILMGTSSSIFEFVDPFEHGMGTEATIVVLLIIIISAIVSVCIRVPLSFTYPAAINENKKGFAAVGRSLTLGFKRYKRTLCAKLLFTLVELIVFAVAYAAVVAVSAIGYLALKQFEAIEVVIMVFAVLALLFVAAFIGTYHAALDTVLYFDARMRTEQDSSRHNNGQSSAQYGHERHTAETTGEEYRDTTEANDDHIPQDNDDKQGESDTTP